MSSIFARGLVYVFATAVTMVFAGNPECDASFQSDLADIKKSIDYAVRLRRQDEYEHVFDITSL